jgi:restriction system protein
MTTHIDAITTSYSARGVPRYQVEMSHDGLHRHRVIKGADRAVVMRKAQVQQDEWNTKWDATNQRDAERRGRDEGRRRRENERDQERRRIENQKELAAERTAEAQEALGRLAHVLGHTLAINDAIDWDSLKDRSPFPEAEPVASEPPSPPTPRQHPREPQSSDADYKPALGLLDHLISSRKHRKTAAAQERFRTDHDQWEMAVKDTEKHNAAAKEEWAKALEANCLRHEASIDAWRQRKEAFDKSQTSANAAMDQQRDRYLKGDAEAVTEYCDMVLARSEYPDYFPHEHELDYVAETKTLVAECSLPSLAALPTLKEVRYNQSKDDFTEKHLSEGEVARLYDSVVYQMLLRSVHELFEADVIHTLDSVVLNGWVRSIDPRTGNEVNACIVSLQTTRQEFAAVNLANVDPKACFKSLKGVGSAKLHSLTAVAPILQMRREDGRFIAAREVVETLTDGDNLAVMDWEDFEHLIRELFEKEFSTGGGEVKITQASRDGGVDAVAFDPDPIRGGKIVIQAKRYTNTVGVAAVRDLYGTVMNEGANKGILVTTADYGPDAYSFAKDKPLTLLNGSNLLHLLEKHGHKARIDIKEARAILREQGA